MPFSMPNFHSALFGYSKREVSVFIRRIESEFDILESRQHASGKTIEALKAENETLTKRAAALTEAETNAITAAETAASDIERITAENEQLRAELASTQASVQQLEIKNHALQKSLDEAAIEYEAVSGLQQELASLREEMRCSESQRSAIPDALISAQRMHDIILAEAHEKAEQLVADAQKLADKTIKDAQNRTAAMKLSYDRMQEDGLRMKNELARICNHHLSLLSDFPYSPDASEHKAE